MHYVQQFIPVYSVNSLQNNQSLDWLGSVTLDTSRLTSDSFRQVKWVPTSKVYFASVRSCFGDLPSLSSDQPFVPKYYSFRCIHLFFLGFHYLYTNGDWRLQQQIPVFSCFDKFLEVNYCPTCTTRLNSLIGNRHRMWRKAHIQTSKIILNRSYVKILIKILVYLLHLICRSYRDDIFLHPTFFKQRSQEGR